MDGERVQGTVLDWSTRGFGFIGLEDGRRAYVHHTQFGGGDLEIGEAVTAIIAQDRQNPEKWAARDIQRGSGSRSQGVVASWNAKGFGFVDLLDGRRAYVHASQFDGKNLLEGEEISCIVVEDQQNPGKWAAMEVQRTFTEIMEATAAAYSAPEYTAAAYSSPSPTSSSEERYEGTVAEWNERGFGFIALNDARRVYMHSSAFGGGNMVAGITVNCTLKEDPRNPGKLSAINVQLGKIRAMPQAEAWHPPPRMELTKNAGHSGERQMWAPARSVADSGSLRVEGRVSEWYERGYGFIDLEDQRRAYVHVSGCLDGDLSPGEVVSCVLEQDAKDSSRWAAKQVRKGALGVDVVVSSWNEKGGFGFVTLDDGSRAYIHVSSMNGRRELEVGQRLRVITKPDDRNPGKVCVAGIKSDFSVPPESSDGGLDPTASASTGGGEIGEIEDSGEDIRPPLTGNVIDWNPKGFGFVSLGDGRKAYVHHTVFGGGELIIGEPVTFKVAPDRRNPGKLMITELSRDLDPDAQDPDALDVMIAELARDPDELDVAAQIALYESEEGPPEKRIRTN